MLVEHPETLCLGEQVMRHLEAATDPLLAAVRREDAELYLKLSRQRDGRVRWRTLVAIALSMLTVLGLGALLLAPAEVRWVALTGLIIVLGEREPL